MNFFHVEYILYGVIALIIILFADFIPNNKYIIPIFSELIFWFLSFFFQYLDTHNGWWRKYKKQDYINDIRFFRIVKQAIKNNVMGYVIYMCILLPLSNNRGFVNHHGIINIVLDVCLLIFTYDLIFYFFHRAIHMPNIYFIHKKHHQTYGNMGITAHYMNPFDFILETFLPFWISTTLWNTCFIASFIVAIVGQINAVLTHSGYTYGINYDPHHLHHLNHKTNFGVTELWDYLLNTKN